MKYFEFIISGSHIRVKGQLILLTVAFFLFFSCTYDDEETLNPLNPCDTVAITYSGLIQPILDAHCYSCHSGNNPRADISLEEYEDVRDLAIDGRLGGVINYEAGYIPMPYRRDQLDSCNLYYINSWIEDGAPNN